MAPSPKLAGAPARVERQVLTEAGDDGGVAGAGAAAAVTQTSTLRLTRPATSCSIGRRTLVSSHCAARRVMPIPCDKPVTDRSRSWSWADQAEAVE